MDSPRIGLIGLGTMGRNLALNLCDHGVQVIGHDPGEAAGAAFIAAGAGSAVPSVAELVAALVPPRVVLLLVPAGEAVDTVMAALAPLLGPDDVAADCGNSHFRDTGRRREQWRRLGLHWLGLGLSGGERGARHGPAIMAGGSGEGLAALVPLLEPIAARTASGPCFGCFGEDGAGHFVKIVHNGIEYAEMQLIAEVFLLLRQGLGLSADEVAAWFKDQADGAHGSYLLEITAAILRRRDDESGLPLVDLVLDSAEQKGTGHWTITAAAELGVAVPTIAASVNARLLSADRPARAEVSQAGLAGPERMRGVYSPDQVASALLAGRLCAFAQGFSLLAAGARSFGWPRGLAEAARVWQGGCIIRTRLLPLLAESLGERQGAVNLLAAPGLAALVAGCDGPWRRVVGSAATGGLPVPALLSALAYRDGLATGILGTNLIQAQRDCFGAHGFQRVDRAGRFHVDWGGGQ